MPGCDTKGRVFVGQRHDGFVVNLGHIFDLINLNPLGARNSSSNTIADKNVTSLALEVPATCLTKGSDPVDRKSVVEGKSVSVRVDLVGCRIIKKKKNKKHKQIE